MNKEETIQLLEQAVKDWSIKVDKSTTAETKYDCSKGLCHYFMSASDLYGFKLIEFVKQYITPFGPPIATESVLYWFPLNIYGSQCRLHLLEKALFHHNQ